MKTILRVKVVEENLNIGVGRVEIPAGNTGKVRAHRINLSSFAIRVRFSADFGTIASQSLGVADVTVPGAALGYPCLVAFEQNLGPGQYEIDGRVTIANTVRVAIFNRSPTQPATVGTVTGTVLVFPIPGAEAP